MQDCPAGQSVFSTHCTHFSPSLQIGVGAAQSALEMHATHVDFATSHFGLPPPHCASLLQPERHFRSSASQMGALAGQSALERHCTHLPRFAQNGSDAPQSALTKHSTHEPVVGEQRAVGAAQSVLLKHPTHAPVVESHSFALDGHDVPCVHEPWHS